jgi:hypothetical protein
MMAKVTVYKTVDPHVYLLLPTGYRTSRKYAYHIILFTMPVYAIYHAVTT